MKDLQSQATQTLRKANCGITSLSGAHLNQYNIASPKKVRQYTASYLLYAPQSVPINGLPMIKVLGPDCERFGP